MGRIIDHPTKFIAMLLGGPASCIKDQIRALHGHLTIRPDHFVALTPGTRRASARRGALGRRERRRGRRAGGRRSWSGPCPPSPPRATRAPFSSSAPAFADPDPSAARPSTRGVRATPAGRGRPVVLTGLANASTNLMTPARMRQEVARPMPQFDEPRTLDRADRQSATFVAGGGATRQGRRDSRPGGWPTPTTRGPGPEFRSAPCRPGMRPVRSSAGARRRGDLRTAPD